MQVSTESLLKQPESLTQHVIARALVGTRIHAPEPISDEDELKSID